MISSWGWRLSVVIWLSPKSPNLSRDWIQKESWNMLNCLGWFLWEGLEEGLRDSDGGKTPSWWAPLSPWCCQPQACSCFSWSLALHSEKKGKGKC